MIEAAKKPCSEGRGKVRSKELRRSLRGSGFASGSREFGPGMWPVRLGSRARRQRAPPASRALRPAPAGTPGASSTAPRSARAGWPASSSRSPSPACHAHRFTAMRDGPELDSQERGGKQPCRFREILVERPARNLRPPYGDPDELPNAACFLLTLALASCQLRGGLSARVSFFRPFWNHTPSARQRREVP
jgi:hypothetical protein